MYCVYTYILQLFYEWVNHCLAPHLMVNEFKNKLEKDGAGLQDAKQSSYFDKMSVFMFVGG